VTNQNHDRPGLITVRLTCINPDAAQELVTRGVPWSQRDDLTVDGAALAFTTAYQSDVAILLTEAEENGLATADAIEAASEEWMAAGPTMPPPDVLARVATAARDYLRALDAFEAAYLVPDCVAAGRVLGAARTHLAEVLRAAGLA